MEDEAWDWNSENEKGKAPVKLQLNENDVDDQFVRGTRSLEDIYARCNVVVIEPVGFQEAMQNKKWFSAMEEELSMIEKNHTWQLVQKPLDRKVIGVKWVFRTKFNVDGLVNKYKARLVVKGYTHVFGVDFVRPEKITIF